MHGAESYGHVSTAELRWGSDIPRMPPSYVEMNLLSTDIAQHRGPHQKPRGNAASSEGEASLPVGGGLLTVSQGIPCQAEGEAKRQFWVSFKFSRGSFSR